MIRSLCFVCHSGMLNSFWRKDFVRVNFPVFQVCHQQHNELECECFVAILNYLFIYCVADVWQHHVSADLKLNMISVLKDLEGTYWTQGVFISFVYVTTIINPKSAKRWFIMYEFHNLYLNILNCCPGLDPKLPQCFLTGFVLEVKKSMTLNWEWRSLQQITNINST